MPLFDLRCPNCGHVEEDVLFLQRGDSRICPACFTPKTGEPLRVQMEKMLPLVAKTPNKWKV